MTRLFGTDGIRGIANEHPITVEMGLHLGRTLVLFCRKHGLRPAIVIGRDTRQSGTMLEQALSAGILSAGGDVCATGVLPTPGVAYFARHLKAGFGVVISASHNPYPYNGFKIFSDQGLKLSDDEEAEIEELLAEPPQYPPQKTASPGWYRQALRAQNRYGRFLETSLAGGPSLKHLSVVIDCANGAASSVAPALFKRVAGRVHVLHAAPDGININQGCGSQHPETLCRAVVEQGADAGLAFDGDADRLIAVDENGAVLSGDQTLTVCAEMLQRQGALAGNSVVSTIMSNCGLQSALQAMGIRHVTTSVGDRQVLAAMMAEGAVLGGEDSGHMIFLSHHSTGDGILSGLQLLKAMTLLAAPLSSLAKRMRIFPQILLNVPVRAKPDLKTLAPLQDVVAEVEGDLNGRGRVLVRYSGTEPLCRVMVEGEEEKAVEDYAHRIARVVQTVLG